MATEGSGREGLAGSALARLRRGAQRSFVLMGLGMGVGMAMHAIAARSLGKAEYGVFSYALSSARLAAVLVALGWPTASMRFVAQYREAEEWGLLRGILARSHRVVLALACVAALVLGLLGWLLLPSPSARLSACLIAVMLPLVSLGLLRSRLLRGLLRVTDSILLERLAIPVLLVACLAVVPMRHGAAVAAAWVAAAIVVRAVETLRLRSARPSSVAEAAPAYRMGEWARVGVGIWLGEATRAILARGDVTMLGLMSGMDDVAVYTAARRVGMLITFTLNAVNVIAGPLLASAYHGGRPSEFRRVLRTSALWSMLGALPVFAAVMVWPAAGLWVFGPDFLAHVSVVRILSLGLFVNAATGPVVMALVMTGRQRHYSTAVIVVAGINLAANAVAIPRWGVHGAAWVATACAAGLNSWLFMQARRVVPTTADPE